MPENLAVVNAEIGLLPDAGGYPTEIQARRYTNPPGRALLAVEMPFQFNPNFMAPRPTPGGYQWHWQLAQQEAYKWRQLADGAGVYRPDLYATHLWNAHAGDIETNLKCVAGTPNNYVCPAPTPAGTCGTNSCAISCSEMVITEFGGSSSLEAFPIGNGIAFWGDAWTPTTTAAGQREYLLQTLCVLKRLGIKKYAHHGVYDSKSFFDSEFSLNPRQLAWRGYWGLKSELSYYNGNGDKPAWTAWRDFNWNDPNLCSPPVPVPATPVLGLYTDAPLYQGAPYYTVNDIGKITYTAANVTSLELNEPKPPGEQYASYSCDPDDSTPGLRESERVGSCAFTNIQAVYTGTITLTGRNTSVDGNPAGGSSTQVAMAFNVGLAPIVTGLSNATTGQVCYLDANPGCVMTAHQRDVLSIWGVGFNPTGGNKVELAHPPSDSEWLHETDGYYFFDWFRTQINAEIGCFVAPGSYTLYVKSKNSGTRSNDAQVSIIAGGNCP